MTNMSRFFLLTRNIATRRPHTASPFPFRKTFFRIQNDPNPIEPTNHHFRTAADPPSLVPTSSSTRLDGFSIELVDHNLWPHSLCGSVAPPPLSPAPVDRDPDTNSASDTRPDIDEIEDLRVRKKLFYKLDRDSKEFEEYNIDFHRRKKPQRKKGQGQGQEKPAVTDLKKGPKKPEKPIRIDLPEKRARARTPTFNQLTGPYHRPFCLDICVTKGSVRACVVHRVTSRVVAVAHSISKDLRLDVGSRKDARACAAVGAVLARRAIEDDVHNVVYTPRKGDRIEGKLEVVLRSIMDNGVDVKVKLKQRRPVKRSIR